MERLISLQHIQYCSSLALNCRKERFSLAKNIRIKKQAKQIIAVYFHSILPLNKLHRFLSLEEYLMPYHYFSVISRVLFCKISKGFKYKPKIKLTIHDSQTPLGFFHFVKQGILIFKYSCGQKFTYAHHGHECHDNLGFLMILLNCSFSGVE